MYVLANFILQNFQNILRANPELWGCAFSGPKWPICYEQKFFGRNHYYYFHLHIGPFHCAKFKKILTVDPELWGCTIFGPNVVHLSQTKFFLENYKIIFIYILAPFIGQNLEKILPVDPELWEWAIFEPKMANFPIWVFLRTPVNKPFPFIQAYLRAKNQSQIFIY